MQEKREGARDGLVVDQDQGLTSYAPSTCPSIEIGLKLSFKKTNSIHFFRPIFQSPPTITPSGAGLSTAFTSISNLLWPLFAVKRFLQYRDFETAAKKKKHVSRSSEGLPSSVRAPLFSSGGFDILMIMILNEVDGVLSKANDNAYNLFQARVIHLLPSIRCAALSLSIRKTTCMSSPPRGPDLLNRVRE
jgi:hypothetical protein